MAALLPAIIFQELNASQFGEEPQKMPIDSAAGRNDFRRSKNPIISLNPLPPDNSGGQKGRIAASSSSCVMAPEDNEIIEFLFLS
jgi:hypothetical protein